MKYLILGFVISCVIIITYFLNYYKTRTKALVKSTQFCVPLEDFDEEDLDLKSGTNKRGAKWHRDNKSQKFISKDQYILIQGSRYANYVEQVKNRNIKFDNERKAHCDKIRKLAVKLSLISIAIAAVIISALYFII